MYTNKAMEWSFIITQAASFVFCNSIFIFLILEHDSIHLRLGFHMCSPRSWGHLFTEINQLNSQWTQLQQNPFAIWLSTLSGSLVDKSRQINPLYLFSNCSNSASMPQKSNNHPFPPPIKNENNKKPNPNPFHAVSEERRSNISWKLKKKYCLQYLRYNLL